MFLLLLHKNLSKLHNSHFTVTTCDNGVGLGSAGWFSLTVSFAATIRHGLGIESPPSLPHSRVWYQGKKDAKPPRLE